METLYNLAQGFSGLFTLANLAAVLTGTVLGTVVGVLPGLGPAATMAVLLPITLSVGPTAGLIMLAGVFYGAQYGGSTTSILLRIPGEASSVITTIDGYEMTKKGRAGAALTASAVGSFIAGTMGFIGLAFFAMPIARMALKLGPPEYFAIGVAGLLILVNVSGGTTVKNCIMALFGISLATVGMDSVLGMPRFDFGTSTLSKGIDYIPVLIGLFGMSEIFEAVINRDSKSAELTRIRMRDLYPTRQEWRRMLPPMFRGGVLGFFMGLIPGPGAIMATYASYGLEKKLSKHPQEFGRGAIEGVAGPESANNSGAAGQLVPVLSLGLPFSALTAMLLGALMMHGITPGPLFITNNPEIFWVLVASLFLGNMMLLVFNLPMVGIFAMVLKVPSKILMPIIALVCLIGTYSLGNNWLDVWIMLVFGVLGVLLQRFKFGTPPLILGMVFGPLIELNLSRSLLMFQGNVFEFWTRPLSGVILGIGILTPIVLLILKARGKVVQNKSSDIF